MPENIKPEAKPKSRFKPGESGNPAGRPKGVPNKTTQLLKDAILLAAEKAGGAEGMVGYLTAQATLNPTGFMSLLGKVLPMQLVGETGGAIEINVTVGGQGAGQP